MSLLKIRSTSLLMLFLAAAAGANETVQSQSEQSPYTRCENPRPEVCNQSYQPVCADRDTGARCIKAPCPQATRKVTYSNSCMACSDQKVFAFKGSACSDSEINNNKL